MIQLETVVFPFSGVFASTGFQVIDELAFEKDPTISQLGAHIEIMSGKHEGDEKRLYCLVHGRDPRKPLRISRHGCEDALMNDGTVYLSVEDPMGWLNALQRHLDPDALIFFVEDNNMSLVGNSQIVWTITFDRAVCCFSAVSDNKEMCIGACN